jgi:hypothetical protein
MARHAMLSARKLEAKSLLLAILPLQPSMHLTEIFYSRAHQSESLNNLNDNIMLVLFAKKWRLDRSKSICFEKCSQQFQFFGLFRLRKMQLNQDV